MQINLPNQLISEILRESATFREFVIEQLSECLPRNQAFYDRFDLFKTQLIEAAKRNKIQAIKDLREMKGEMREFVDIIAAEKRIFLSPYIGLAEAKNFIESL